MRPLCNTAQRKQGSLRKAEANLLIIAKSFLAAKGPASQTKLERKFRKASQIVMRARLAYLKARRWVLLDEPDRQKIEQHKEELDAIAQEEARTLRDGVETIFRDTLKEVNK